LDAPLKINVIDLEIINIKCSETATLTVVA